jgi:hypothetical protein
MPQSQRAAKGQNGEFAIYAMTTSIEFLAYFLHGFENGKRLAG